MAVSFQSKIAVGPARSGPGNAAAPLGRAGNEYLGSLGGVSRPPQARLRADLDRLYQDVIACGAAARQWFDGAARDAGLPPEDAAEVATESLAITARLMAVMNWLLDPAHQGPVTSLRPLEHDDRPALAEPHPLAAGGKPGEDAGRGLAIARTSRHLLARAQALSAVNAPR
jgi:hypothetical protein